MRIQSDGFGPVFRRWGETTTVFAMANEWSSPVRELSSASNSVHSRPAVVAFFTFAAILVCLLFYLQRPSANDPFSHPERLTGLSARPGIDVLAAKFAHGSLRQEIGAGLFGNSRSVSVGRAHFSDSPPDFFNYSVPGTSFRTSVGLLEQLVARQRVPKVVFISLDHLAIDYFGPRISPTVEMRFGTFIDDMQRLLDGRDTIGKPTVKAIWRQVWQEWKFLEEAFNADVLKARLFGVSGNPARQYLADGSFPPRSGHEWRVSFPTVVPASGQVLMDVLLSDLRRLDAVARESGSTIIVYESPIHRQARVRTDALDNARTMIARSCAGLMLTCILEPDQTMFDGDEAWPDANHPPPATLARFLEKIIADIKSKSDAGPHDI